MKEDTGTDEHDLSGEAVQKVHSIPVPELPVDTNVSSLWTSRELEGEEEPKTNTASASACASLVDAKRPWYILPAIVFSQFAGTALWFAGNAILPDLVEEWENLDESSLGYLTSSVQFGFIVGTLLFALLGVADRYPPTKVFFVCALAGASCNAIIPACRQSVGGLVVLRLATGFFLAGIYPVGMKVSFCFSMTARSANPYPNNHKSWLRLFEGGLRLVSGRTGKGIGILGWRLGRREQFPIFAAANSSILASSIVGNKWHCSRGRDCGGASSARGTLSQSGGAEIGSYDYVWTLSK
jgi:hypothetical protein